MLKVCIPAAMKGRVRVLKQTKCTDKAHLLQYENEIVEKGGEG